MEEPLFAFPVLLVHQGPYDPLLLDTSKQD